MRKSLLLLIFLGLALFSFVRPAKAWLDCPFDNVNDPYPGSCARYIDTDGNQICDHSEPSPKERAAALKEQKSDTVNNRPINLVVWLISLPSATYFIHWYLVYKTSEAEKFDWLNHRSFTYFWNLVLLASFLPTGVSGILILLGSKSTPLFSWHNYAGALFTTVAFLHILARLKYFTQILKGF